MALMSSYYDEYCEYKTEYSSTDYVATCIGLKDGVTAPEKLSILAKFSMNG
jgi:hypothetical protein